MPAELPYMNTSGNVGAILDRIRTAGSPPRFTLEFLQQLGFTSSNARGIIKVLKQLGLLDESGVPTDAYHEFHHAERSGQVLAEGLRSGWRDVFLVEARPQDRSVSQLVGVFSRVTGKGEAVATKMASTFRAVVDKADLDTAPAETPPAVPPTAGLEPAGSVETLAPSGRTELSIGLHHDIHIHLPPTTDVAVYIAIFRALRSELGE